MKKKLLACPDCRKKYFDLETLNKHIAKTGHNDGKKITKMEILVAIGFFKPLDVNIQHPLPAI